MIKNFICILLFLFFSFGFSQTNYFYEEYTWEENPNYKQPSDENESIIGIKEKYAVEFAYASENALVEYFLEHKVIWLNSDEKIEEYNKIYLPYASNSELLISKARVITKQGNVIVLDDSKILTASNEETGRQYKFFAFEGIEKGSFIEYYYVEKKYPSYKGTIFRLQNSFHKNSVEFDLFSPKNLVFDFKSYHNIPEITRDTITQEKLHWKLKIDHLTGLEEESQSPYNAYRGAIIYKLDKNLNNNTNDISSYGNVSQNIYSFYYEQPSKKANNHITKLISEAISEQNKDDSYKLNSIDRYIKTNFYFSEEDSKELNSLEDVLDKKIANSSGMVKLYVALLNALGIQHEIVITSDIEQIVFDKDFEANNFLTDFLIYFPEYETYLSPTDNTTRYAYPPANLTNNYGLFIKEVVIGDFKSGLGKVKFIQPLSADKTTDKMVIDLDFFENDISKNKIKLQRSFTGYYAMPIQPYLYLVKDKDREELIEGLAKTMNENVKVTQMSANNDKPDSFGNEPLEFTIDLESDAFTEKAGNKYLLKIGELIGRQIQMYQEKERVLPLLDEFKRSYYRTINIKIPKGYQVVNLEDLNINNTFEKDGIELLSFKSFFSLKDNLLSITADEHYRVNFIEATNIEPYRKVINSAADFNKITLILEPSK